MTTFRRSPDGKLIPVAPPAVVKSLEQILNEAKQAAYNPETDEVDPLGAAQAVRTVTAADVRTTAIKTLRTFVQAFAGGLAVSLPTALTTVHDWSTARATVISIAASSATAGATAAFTYVHNTLEDRGIIRSRKGY